MNCEQSFGFESETFGPKLPTHKNRWKGTQYETKIHGLRTNFDLKYSTFFRTSKLEEYAKVFLKTSN